MRMLLVIALFAVAVSFDARCQLNDENYRPNLLHLFSKS